MIIRKCKICQSDVKVSPSQEKDRFCCGEKCSREYRREKSILARTKKCEVCHSIFVGQSKISRFCSIHCSRKDQSHVEKAASWEKYKKECGVCGVEFLPPRQSEGGRFCSYKCSGINNRKDRIYRAGYYMIRNNDHPNCTAQGYVLEHRHIMEQAIGRHLSGDEVVHHINLEKGDNRIKNLKIMTDSEHKSYHANLTCMANSYTGKACKEVNGGRFI
jgi:hypothetical protein